MQYIILAIIFQISILRYTFGSLLLNIGQVWFYITEDQGLILQDESGKWLYLRFNKKGDITYQIQLKDFIGIDWADQYILEVDSINNQKMLYIFTTAETEYQIINFNQMISTQQNGVFQCSKDIKKFGNRSTYFFKRDGLYVKQSYNDKTISIDKNFSLNNFANSFSGISDFNITPYLFQYKEQNGNFIIYWKGKKYTYNNERYKNFIVIDQKNDIFLVIDWAASQVLSTLIKLDLSQNTLTSIQSVNINVKYAIDPITGLLDLDGVSIIGFGENETGLQFYNLCTFEKVAYSHDSEKLTYEWNNNEFGEGRELLITNQNIIILKDKIYKIKFDKDNNLISLELLKSNLSEIYSLRFSYSGFRTTFTLGQTQILYSPSKYKYFLVSLETLMGKDSFLSNYKEGNISELNCLNNCPKGYYYGKNACLKCSSQCLECTGNADQCTACQLSLNFYKNQCLQKCPPKTYVIIE